MYTSVHFGPKNESNGSTEPQDQFKESQSPISVEPQNGKMRATT